MRDSELDALLARGRLSGPTRDRVLNGVLEKVQPAAPRRRVRSTALLVLPAAAAIALLVGGGRLASTLSGRRDASGTFNAKGAASDAVHVDAACTGGPMLACPRGSRLVFRVQAGDRSGFLTAYAAPAGGGERIWYFSAESESPFVQSGVLERAVVIGPEHAADRYVIHALVTARSLTRAEALRAQPRSLLGDDSQELSLLP
jgi:hypothetical protein